MTGSKLDLYKTFAGDYAAPRDPVIVEPHAAQYLAISLKTILRMPVRH